MPSLLRRQRPLRRWVRTSQAALDAVRQWRYEVTKVAGHPVPVRLTVPLSFASKLPEMTREPGIPELRHGVGPALPSENAARGGGVGTRHAAPRSTSAR